MSQRRDSQQTGGGNGRDGNVPPLGKHDRWFLPEEDRNRGEEAQHDLE
jgi:hypothetical protein